MSPRVVAVIPARYHSTRLPGKALAEIDGRPMIEHVYRRAARARGVDAVIVATDNERIAEAVARFGGEARMTSGAHRTGTDRIAEVAAHLTCEIVVNVQGDEPLIEPEMIEQAIAPLVSPEVVMTTLRRAMNDLEEIASPHVVKVVVDRNEDALYFSRSPIPFRRDQGVRLKPDTTPDTTPVRLKPDATPDTTPVRLKPDATPDTTPVRLKPDATPDTTPARLKPDATYVGVAYKHIGLYGYRREFLLTLAGLPPTPLEIAESLEQLRALEHGFRIRTPETTFDSIGVDTPDDLDRVRRQLRELATGART